MKGVMFWLFCASCFNLSFSFLPKFEKQLASTIPCRSDSDCKRYSEHSLCINNTVDTPGHCECFKDYIPQQNKTYFQCLARPDSFGGACVKDIQCQYEFSNWAVCRSGHCACIEGAHFWDKQCYQSIGLGQTCSFNQQCRLKNGNIASCLAGRCSCGFLEHPVSKPDGDSCEKNRELGEQCNKDEECVTEHTRCVGVCDCKPGYTTNGDGRGCLREAEALGDYCMEDAQCEIISNYTYCEQFTCRCRNHHHNYLGKCYRSVRLNGTCHDNRNCWYIPDFKDKIHCKEGRCSCVHQYTSDGKFCESAGFKLQDSVFVIVLANILIWKMILL